MNKILVVPAFVLILALKPSTMRCYQKKNHPDFALNKNIIPRWPTKDHDAHLGKPMDVLLRGGRSKRSKDLDLDATLLLRWAAWPFEFEFEFEFEGQPACQKRMNFSPPLVGTEINFDRAT